MKKSVVEVIKIKDVRTEDGRTVLDLSNGVKVVYPKTFCPAAVLHYSEEIANLFQACGYLPLPHYLNLCE